MCRHTPTDTNRMHSSDDISQNRHTCMYHATYNCPISQPNRTFLGDQTIISYSLRFFFRCQIANAKLMRETVIDQRPDRLLRSVAKQPVITWRRPWLTMSVFNLHLLLSVA